MIRLISTIASGQTPMLPAALIEGALVPVRSYAIDDEHVATLDGYPDAVLNHDAMLLLQQPGIRSITPSEQNALRQRDEAAKIAEE